MQLLTSSVGRKILMAITGIFMVMFVVVHLLGNSSIYIPGGINAYAEHLHALPPVVWAFRLVMLALVGVHIIFGIQLTLENNAASPKGYAAKNQLKANFSSENMIWTGVLILLFIIGHMLHFTARLTPDIVLSHDAMGRFDVFKMVTSSFSSPFVAILYVAAMVVLYLHLKHGIQSFFQTMGWNNDRTLPVFTAIGMVVAFIFLIGYSAIPLLIVSRILN